MARGSGSRYPGAHLTPAALWARSSRTLPPPSAPAPPTAVVMAGRVMLTTLRCFFAACSLPEPGRGTAPTPGAACHDNDHWRSRRPRDRWLGRERRRGVVHADSASREHTHPCVFFKKKRTHSLIHASVRKHKTTSHSYKNAHILKFTVVYTRTRPISHYNDKKNVHIL